MLNYSFTMVFLLCYLAFLYQFISITRDYLKFETITKVEYRIDKHIRVPSLTLGFENPIPMYELYFKIFPNDTIRDFYSLKSWHFSKLGQSCERIYNQTRKTYWDSLNWKKRDYTELWDCFIYYYNNATINNYLEKVTFYQHFEYSIQDAVIPKNCSFKYSTQGDIYANYSIGYFGMVGITLFSRLPDCIQVNKEVIVNVRYNYWNLMPFTRWLHSIEIHSRKNLPHYNRALFIDVEREHSIRYSSVTIKRLPPPHDTECFDYSHISFLVSKFRDDCIARCLFQKVLTSPNKTFNAFFRVYDGYFISSDLIDKNARISQILKDKNIEMSVNHKWFRNRESECEAVCKPACDEITYVWSAFASSRVFNRQNSITITHSYKDNILYQHLKAMDLFSFLGNVGGLGGMWIGVSILSLWHQVENLYKQIKIKIKRSLTKMLFKKRNRNIILQKRN